MPQRAKFMALNAAVAEFLNAPERSDDFYTLDPGPRFERGVFTHLGHGDPALPGTCALFHVTCVVPCGCVVP